MSKTEIPEAPAFVPAPYRPWWAVAVLGIMAVVAALVYGRFDLAVQLGTEAVQAVPVEQVLLLDTDGDTDVPAPAVPTEAPAALPVELEHVEPEPTEPAIQ